MLGLEEFRRLKRAILGSSSFVARTCEHHPRTAKSKVGHVKSKRDPSKVRTGAISARKLPACWHLDRIVRCRTERSFGIHSQLHFAARMRVRESEATACSALRMTIRESQSFSLEEGTSFGHAAVQKKALRLSLRCVMIGDSRCC